MYEVFIYMNEWDILTNQTALAYKNKKNEYYYCIECDTFHGERNAAGHFFLKCPRCGRVKSYSKKLSPDIASVVKLIS